MVPTLALGIPGSTTTAIILAGLLVQGVRPGPHLFNEQPTLLYAVFSSMLARTCSISCSASSRRSYLPVWRRREAEAAEDEADDAARRKRATSRVSVKAITDPLVTDAETLENHGVSLVAINSNDAVSYPGDSFANMATVRTRARIQLFPTSTTASEASAARSRLATCSAV